MTDAALPSRATLRDWVLASRPATLTAALVPVMVGTAVAFAQGGLRIDTALAALLGAMLIQIGTNFANDVFDAEKGADTEKRMGPKRAVAAGLITAKTMRAAMTATFALATLSGLYLVWTSGWIIVLIGVFSIASGIAYTGGPYPLGYNGLGDVFVMIFFGFVAVVGTTFVQTNDAPMLAWVASIPVGAIATAVLVVNNVRDRETDVVAKKNTLIVRHGKAFGVWEYRALLLAAFGTALLLALLTARPSLLACFVLTPWALGLEKQLRTLEGPPLNATLASTAKLLLVYGVFFSSALVFEALR
jgi:1,4-dihydroxy-2-naphthoate octaprenyltransferase